MSSQQIRYQETYSNAWKPARLIRVFRDSGRTVCELADSRTGGRRFIPIERVQTQEIGPRGGRSWVAMEAADSTPSP